MDLELQQLRTLFLVLLGLSAVALAVLVGYIVVASRTRRRLERERAEAEQSEQVIREAWAARQATGLVLALFRDEPGSPLEVEVGGARYRRLAEIQDPQLKRQVVEAALDLVRFTGALGAESVAPAPVDKTYSWREDLRKELRSQPAPAPAPVRPPREEVEEQFLNLLSEMGPPPSPEKPSLAAAIQHRLSPKATRPDQPRSFIDDIEDIVQRRVLLIPALAGRELHVRQGSDGTVHFLFDGQDYDSPDDIPNLTARQLIRDAIQEWDETT